MIEALASEPLTDKVVKALEDSGWSVTICELNANAGGCLLEIEKFTEQTGYDFVANLDMRNRDVSEPSAWIEQMRSLFDEFDPIGEAVLWLGGKGAPTLRAMIRDFESFKTNSLEPLAGMLAAAFEKQEESESVAPIAAPARLDAQGTLCLKASMGATVERGSPKSQRTGNPER